jgi:hypothetical protein
MPSLTYDSQSFIWNGRRLWISGASLEYSLLAPSRWRPSLLALRRMGFNTIRTSVPWCLHEAREGRMDFTGSLDAAAFIGLCRELGLHVVLRIGPVVGEPFDGGGLPAWLADVAELQPRVVNEAFLGRVSKLFNAVGKQTSPLQATLEQRRGGAFAGGTPNDGGPLIAVQIEHGWNCGNETAGRAYHAELLRFARESGFTVPVITSNGLWISVEGCVETWEGWNDLFPNVRQLRSLQPDAPRLAEISDEAARAERLTDAPRCTAAAAAAHERAAKHAPSAMSLGAWSDGMDVLRRAGQVLCAGGQFTVPGAARSDRAPALPAMLDASGRVIDDMRPLRRLAHFAGSFAFALAATDPARQSAVQNLDALAPGAFAVVTLEGGGHVAFVFRGPDEPGKPRRDATSLIMPCGVRLAVRLGDAPLAWFVSGVNLQGAGVLDYCNLSPVALIGKRMLVLHGAAGRPGVLSIDGVEVEFTVPKDDADAAPLVLTHQKMTIVVCNQRQIDAALIDDDGVTIGADEAPGFRSAVRVALDGAVTRLRAAAPRTSVQRALASWRVAECDEFVQGTSARFATLAGPRSLAACGASAGWGWYRLGWNGDGAAAAIRAHFPQARGFMRAWIDGRALGELGGDGAALPLTIPAGASSGAALRNGARGAERDRAIHRRALTLLARQGGRGVNDASRNRSIGVDGDALPVSPLKTSLQLVASPRIDPFEARDFLAGLAPGHHMASHTARFAFTVRGKSAVVFDAPGAWVRCVVVLNGVVIDFIDWRGALGDAMVLRPAAKGSKRGLRAGANELLLVPVDFMGDGTKSAESCVRDIARSLRFFEADGAAPAAWSFARWEMPERDSPAWKPLKSLKPGAPRWFAAPLARPEAGAEIALACAGLSRGHVLLDGAIVGDYDAGAKRLLVDIPAESITGDSTLGIFDLEGRSPAGVKIVTRR